MKAGKRRYWINVVLVAGVETVLVLAALVGGFCYLKVTAYLHPPRVSASGDFLRLRGIPYQEVELLTEDGIPLYAWYTPPRNGAVILIGHGQGGSIPEDLYVLFAGHGYGVLAWEFRGHGRSGGNFTSIGYYETLDAKAALDFALAQPDVEHVGAWGGSMGASTLIRAAARYPGIEAVVSDSGFAALRDQFLRRIPYPFLRLLMQAIAEAETGSRIDWVRPVDDIARISPRPVYIIQGLKDSAVPPDSARQLFDAAGEPRFLWLGEDAYHMNMYARYPAEYEQRVLGFFDRYLLGK
jgi:fermentation-respiration switch protein FrsA (DUF1100 family)